MVESHSCTCSNSSSSLLIYPRSKAGTGKTDDCYCPPLLSFEGSKTCSITASHKGKDLPLKYISGLFSEQSPVQESKTHPFRRGSNGTAPAAKRLSKDTGRLSHEGILTCTALVIKDHSKSYTLKGIRLNLQKQLTYFIFSSRRI